MEDRGTLLAILEEIGEVFTQTRQQHIQRMQGLVISPFFCILFAGSFGVLWWWKDFSIFPYLVCLLLFLVARWFRKGMLQLLEGIQVAEDNCGALTLLRDLRERLSRGETIVPKEEPLFMEIMKDTQFVLLFPKSAVDLRRLLNLPPPTKE